MTSGRRPGPAFVRHPAALWRRTLDGVVVLPPEGDEPLHVSGPGHAIWQLLAEPATLDELTADVAALFRCPAADVRGDVERVLRSFVEAGAALPSNAAADFRPR